MIKVDIKKVKMTEYLRMKRVSIYIYSPSLLILFKSREAVSGAEQKNGSWSSAWLTSTGW
jgi:hypothetical protein